MLHLPARDIPVPTSVSPEAQSVLADRDPFVQPLRNLSRGRRYMYSVQIGADSRKDADRICAALRSKGGACIVQKN